MLGAAAGAGITAAVAAGAGSAQAAPASGTPVELGMQNTTTGTTAITSTAGNGLRGTSSTDGFSGLSGHDNSSGASGKGIAGSSANGIGVYGTSVLGIGVSGKIAGDIAGTGVYGSVNQAGGSGVYGQDLSTGNGGGAGVSGVTNVGTGVFASALDSGGIALQVNGPTQFSRCGIATVKGTSTSAKNSVTVTPAGGITTSSMILATSQSAGAAVAYVGRDLKAGNFTIHLTASVQISVEIAWLVIEQGL
jgi:hypothetical protein